MKKLASIIDAVSATARQEQAKLASAGLSIENAPPTISSEIGLSLQKLAARLKECSAGEVTDSDLQGFLKGLRDA